MVAIGPMPRVKMIYARICSSYSHFFFLYQYELAYDEMNIMTSNYAIWWSLPQKF